jgi:peptidoglycan/LPS O-acetylase OafA/YrhL
MSVTTGHDLGRDNALGLLRLALASLVIVSHTPEIADGNRAREPLSRLFGTISFGELAVDAFFVISGYLIVMSYVKSATITDYLRKRITRIYPGFLVASFISLLIVAPLVGASFSGILANLPWYIGKIAALQYLEVPGTFQSLGHPDVNGAVWTIAYEFRCYILVIALGVIGAFRRPALIAIAAAAAMAVYVAVPADNLRALGLRLPLSRVWIGWLDTTLRLTSIFLVGSLFYLWRSYIPLTGRGALASVAGLIAALCWPATAEAGVAIAGGYLIFAFAVWGRTAGLSDINNRNDISYGTYLYGWPIGACILWAFPSLPLAAAAVVTIALSLIAGWLSWHLVEKPAINRMVRGIR